ncbi:MAG: response regulator [Planctomycetota bacterium]
MRSRMQSSEHQRRGVFFHQGCPVCGRRLEIDVALLGARVYCQHCGGGFLAMDPSLASRGRSESTDRADELLARAAMLLAQAEGAG